MRILILLLLLPLGLTVGHAQQAAPDNEQTQVQSSDQLKHKIAMVDYMLSSPVMLQRMQASDDELAKKILARATVNFLEIEEYFDRGQFLEAEAIIDYVLRDISAASRLLNVSRQMKSRYQISMEQLDSFVLPEWKNLSAEESEFLQGVLIKINALRDEAFNHAQSGDYDRAVALVDQAYGMKSSLIDKLQHEQTIVYDLTFETIDEEYDYLNKRSYHYLELVEHAVARSAVDIQSRKLLDSYIYESMINLEAAENFQSEGRVAEANSALEKSIKQLTSALKILGITI
jgi:hypothetical protein